TSSLRIFLLPKTLFPRMDPSSSPQCRRTIPRPSRYPPDGPRSYPRDETLPGCRVSRVRPSIQLLQKPLMPGADNGEQQVFRARDLVMQHRNEGARAFVIVRHLRVIMSTWIR